MEPKKTRKTLMLSNGDNLEVVIVAYQTTLLNDKFEMLHNCRQEKGSKFFIPVEEAEDAFRKWCKSSQPLFASTTGGPVFDFLVVAPSNKNFAGILRNHAEINHQSDISQRFAKIDDASSAEPGTKLPDVFQSICYQSAGDEEEANSVAIIDDVVSDGKTAAAIIQRLREAGLRKDAKIIVFCAHYRFGQSIAEAYRAMKRTV